METRDVFLAGYAARLIQDRQQAEREALALRAEYMAQVTAYMNQGYAIDEAHSLVQEFYERQAQMQAAIAARPRTPKKTWAQIKAERGRDYWVLVSVIGFNVIFFGLGGLLALLR